MAVKVKNNLMKWGVLILIGTFAYLSGFLFGNRTHHEQVQLRSTASKAPPVVVSPPEPVLDTKTLPKKVQK